jgi:NCS1 family nucleobase:cation symporter-1
MTSSANFGTYLSAYSVLLSSVVGVMLCDYYFIRRGNYRVADLYTNSKTSWYYYTYGVNFRAFAAYLAGIAPNLPGLANAVSGKNLVPIEATHVYTFSWFTGIAASMLVYYGLNRVWPSRGAFPETFCEVDLSEYEEYGIPKPVVVYDEAALSADLDEKKVHDGESRTNVVELDV